jgi:uroporphyrinogen decarboxylase
MIEGGGSRHYVRTKTMMHTDPQLFDELLAKIVAVTADYAAEQVRAGADVIQVFDSWVGCLSPRDYRQHVLARTRDLVRKLKKTGAPVIYFGTDTTTLLSAMQETGADVIGLDWRVPLDQGWAELEDRGGVQGNLDPVVLFSSWKQVEAGARDVLDRAAGRPGHIFNLGHGILPETPVDNVKALVSFVQEYSAKYSQSRA